MKKHARRGARQDAEGVCGFLSDRTAIQTGVKGTGHPVEQTDASGKSRRKTEEQAAVRVGEPALRSEEQPSRAKDEKHLVLKRILAAHEQWFDVRRGYEYAGRTFPGYAEFHSYGEKYVLVKARSYGKSTRMSICSSSSPMPWTKLRCAILCRSWNMMGSKRWFPSRTICPRPYPW